MTPLESEVISLIAATVGTTEECIHRDTLLRDLMGDSLDAVGLIMALEDEFHVDIPDEDAVEIGTVKQLVEYITFASAHQDAHWRPSREPIRLAAQRR